MWELFIQNHRADFSIVGYVASFSLCWWVMLQAKKSSSSYSYIMYVYVKQTALVGVMGGFRNVQPSPTCTGQEAILGHSEERRKMGHSKEQSKKTIPSPGVSTFQVQQGFSLSSHTWGTLGTQSTAGHFKAWPMENFSPLGKASRIWLTEWEGESVCVTCVNLALVFISPTLTYQQKISFATVQKKFHSALWYVQLTAQWSSLKQWWKLS